MQGVRDLCIVEADQSHRQRYLDTWALSYVTEKLQNAACKYRLFPWEEIIDRCWTVAAVDAAGSVEGLIALGITATAVRVFFVAAAPWNASTAGQRLRRGVGPALLRYAIDTSIEMGRDGALELSSTPESESFYEANGFVRSGDRDKEGLAIFTLSPAAAVLFATRHERVGEAKA